MIEPDANRCRLTLDLPWEVADYLVEFMPALLRDLEKALLRRDETRARRVTAGQQLELEALSNFAAWEKFYDEFRAELRKANHPSQRGLIARTVALRHGLRAGDAESILRVVNARRRKARGRKK